MAMISKVSLPFPPEKMDDKQTDPSIYTRLNFRVENFVRNLGNKEEDEEIGVFGAEKYFNGGMDDEPSISLSISVKKTQFEKISENFDLQSTEKPKIQPRTPSVRSELSWNSRSALLQSTERASTKSRTNEGKKFLSRCWCSCCDISSVDVMEELSDFKTQNPGQIDVKRSSKIDKLKKIESRSWLKEEIGETFTFPISKPEPGKTPAKVLNYREEEQESSAVNGGPYNDAASDGSSDLFEIESLAGKSGCFHGRQSSDTTNCFTRSTCYAPSEVSIDWSVVTASVGDFSAASEDDSDQRPVAAKSGNSVPKRRAGIFPGCKNEKSVGVATNANRKNERGCLNAPARRVADKVPPLTRFEGETTVIGVSARQRNLALSSLSHPRLLRTEIGNLLEIKK